MLLAKETLPLSSLKRWGSIDIYFIFVLFLGWLSKQMGKGSKTRSIHNSHLALNEGGPLRLAHFH